MNGSAPPPPPGALVLASGGMDSCVCVALAMRDYAAPAPPALLHVDYGQRTEARERQAFAALADHYQIRRRLVVACPGLAAIGGSALTDPAIPVPLAAPAPGEVPVTYVPFRNAHLLALAVSWAEVLGSQVILIGA
ncbi:MAG: 7-cyano-7-deazaguanine synthase, partial [Terriglobales bacterium]